MTEVYANSAIRNVERCSTLSREIAEQVAAARDMIAASQRLLQSCSGGPPKRTESHPPAASACGALVELASVLIRAVELANTTDSDAVNTLVRAALLEVGHQLARSYQSARDGQSVH